MCKHISFRKRTFVPSAMFWKFDLHTSSHLEALLDKDDTTLTELMDEEDVLQECKAQNRRCVFFSNNFGVSVEYNYLTFQSVLLALTTHFSIFWICRLLLFLSQDECMKELVYMITTEPPTGVDETKRFKQVMVALSRINKCINVIRKRLKTKDA